jgi:hypothetical protein
MEWRILLPGSLAAAGAAGIIVLEVWLQTEEAWTEERKQLITALSAALSTAIGALLVKGAETYDESWLAGPIKKAFREQLKPKSGTRGYNLLHTNLEAPWSRTDRRERVDGIQTDMEAQRQLP